MTNILTIASTRIFIRDSEKIIRHMPNHPLQFLLIDGRVKGGSGLTHVELGLDDILVQDGHRDSAFMLESLRSESSPERIDRLALQHAFENQIQGRFEESLLVGSADSPAILIGDVPVFLSTTQIWVAQGKLDTDVVRNAIRLLSIYNQ